MVVPPDEPVAFELAQPLREYLRRDAAELTFQHDAFQLRATLRTGKREYTVAVVQEEVELVGSG